MTILLAFLSGVSVTLVVTGVLVLRANHKRYMTQRWRYYCEDRKD